MSFFFLAHHVYKYYVNRLCVTSNNYLSTSITKPIRKYYDKLIILLRFPRL